MSTNHTPKSKSVVDVSYDKKNNRYFVSSKDFFLINKSNTRDPQELYNKPMFKIDNFFEHNIQEALKKGWEKFVVTGVKDDSKDFKSVGREISVTIADAIWDHKREQTLKNVYDKVSSHPNTDHNSDNFKNLANKYMLARVLNQETVDFEKTSNWCKSVIESSTNKKEDSQKLERYFNNLDSFVSMLEKEGLMSQSKENEDLYVLKANKFVKTKLGLLTHVEATVNEKTLKEAVLAGNEAKEKWFLKKEASEDASDTMKQVRKMYSEHKTTGKNPFERSEKNKTNKTDENQLNEEAVKEQKVDLEENQQKSPKQRNSRR